MVSYQQPVINLPLKLCLNYIPMNRIQFHKEIGQIAVVFKLNERPPEGDILNRQEMERIGYSFKIMERLE